MALLAVPKATDRDDTRQPRWHSVTDDGKKSARIVCADCGKGAYLDHTIADDGKVSPSVVCPHEGCTWHVFVRLEGW